MTAGVMVMERIHDAESARQLFDKAENVSEKIEVLVRVSQELAEHHKKGVLQKDMHLGNFLLSKDKVFALDAGQMQFTRKKISLKKGIAQLALLSFNLADEQHEAIDRLCSEYSQVRGIKWERKKQEYFKRQRKKYFRRLIRKVLKKSLRTSGRFLRVRKGCYLGVFERYFCEEKLPFGFMARIDELIEQGKVLKDGNTCSLSRIQWAGRDLVIKRYNHKGIIHSLRQTIKRSRARRGWLHSHRLLMLKVPTPQPLGFIEHRRWGLVWKSYLINKYIAGQSMRDFLRKQQQTREQTMRMIGQVQQLFEKMGAHRISHGDTKDTNILITDSGPVVLDLDGMKSHRLEWIYRLKRRKDLQRLPDKKAFEGTEEGNQKSV